MNSSSGRVAAVDSGSGAATTSYAEAKKLVTVSVTNKGDCPIVVEMQDRWGKPVARSTLAPMSGKMDRSGKGVQSVHLRWQGPGKCAFDYKILVS